MRALRSLLMLRERVEEREEQMLAEAVRAARQGRAVVDELGVALVALRGDGAAGPGALWMGAEHQEREAALQKLKASEMAARQASIGLEQRCDEQMQTYRVARAEREVISSLMEQRRRAELAAMYLRERKAAEELNLGRRVLRQQEDAREAR